MRAPVSVVIRACLLALLALALGCGREKRDAPNLCDTAAASQLEPRLTPAEAAQRQAVCQPQQPGTDGKPLAQCEENSSILGCPAGAHCDDGKCELSCVAGGESRCGDGYTCTAEGRCVERGWVWVILDFPATKWVILILLLVMPLASILTWMERRQSAMMQDRLGPNRANIGPIKLKGILHFVADAVKMIFKEDFIPANVHRGLFALAPILAIAPVFIAFAIIPFGPTIYPHALTETIDPFLAAQNTDLFRDAIRLQIWQIDFGLIFYFAVLTLANYGGTIAGWASYNKFALLGGLRSSSQMMSYEVAMGLSLMGAFLVAGSLEPGYIVSHGASASMSPADPLNWLWLWQPLGLVLFFTAAIAETKRAPFDIPEGEPEIIGYFVEYSGLRWGLFFLAEFVEIVFISAVVATVFFGGYHVPYLDPDGFRMFGMTIQLPHIVVALLQIGAFGAKTFILCWFQLMIRWTLPRFRADQLMNLGWKLLLPLALANVMVTALIKLLFID